MGNASDDCKKVAKYETLSNGEDGIAAAIEKFIFNASKPKLLVSACLLGENCKYNGGNNYTEEVANLKDKFDLIPICPECFGGLPIPRVPNEIINGRAISKNGEDFTAEYEDGAEKTLYIANECNCGYAVLKERSPSCGFGKIYDGSFTGTLVDGNGITADLLDQNDICIFGESQINKLLDLFDF
ncbi:MAG: 2-thiouracil desulfurase family protein [Eubacterium sp.]|nr:2-thiouracil desulfurase family protein [Eubacterium sp.]